MICRDKDFHKNSPVHTKQFVAATCHRDMLLQLVAKCVPTFKANYTTGSTFPTLYEQQCGFLFVPQEYLLHVQWNLVNTDTKGIINNYSSSPNRLRVNSPSG